MASARLSPLSVIASRFLRRNLASAIPRLSLEPPPMLSSSPYSSKNLSIPTAVKISLSVSVAARIVCLENRVISSSNYQRIDNRTPTVREGILPPGFGDTKPLAHPDHRSHTELPRQEIGHPKDTAYFRDAPSVSLLVDPDLIHLVSGWRRPSGRLASARVLCRHPRRHEYDWCGRG